LLEVLHYGLSFGGIDFDRNLKKNPGQSQNEDRINRNTRTKNVQQQQQQQQQQQPTSVKRLEL